MTTNVDVLVDRYLTDLEADLHAVRPCASAAAREDRWRPRSGVTGSGAGAGGSRSSPGPDG
jgi:hypothetical protein